MAKSTTLKPVALAVGAALAASLGSVTVANASADLFSMSTLSSGYMTHAMGEGKCGEAKCGGEKAEEGKCGEDKAEEGKCGEGKCGEGKCGEDK